MKLLGYRLLVEPIAPEQTGRIILPPKHVIDDRPSIRARIVAIGSKNRRKPKKPTNSHGKSVVLSDEWRQSNADLDDLQPGDEVLIDQNGGVEVKVDGKSLRIISAHDAVAVMSGSELGIVYQSTEEADMRQPYTHVGNGQ